MGHYGHLSGADRFHGRGRLPSPFPQRPAAGDRRAQKSPANAVRRSPSGIPQIPQRSRKQLIRNDGDMAAEMCTALPFPQQKPCNLRGCVCPHRLSRKRRRCRHSICRAAGNRPHSSLPAKKNPTPLCRGIPFCTAEGPASAGAAAFLPHRKTVFLRILFTNAFVCSIIYTKTSCSGAAQPHAEPQNGSLRLIRSRHVLPRLFSACVQPESGFARDRSGQQRLHNASDYFKFLPRRISFYESVPYYTRKSHHAVRFL